MSALDASRAANKIRAHPMGTVVLHQMCVPAVMEVSVGSTVKLSWFFIREIDSPAFVA